MADSPLRLRAERYARVMATALVFWFLGGFILMMLVGALHSWWPDIPTLGYRNAWFLSVWAYAMVGLLHGYTTS